VDLQAGYREGTIKLAKKIRYPLLSARILTLLSVITIIVVSIIFIIFGHKSFLVELEWSVGIISLCLFLFLSIGLYKGVRIKNEPIVKGKWKPLKGSDAMDLLSCVPDLPLPWEIGAEGCGGIILAIVAWLIFTVVALILLYLLANVLWGLIFIFAVVVYWIFYRALRQVFIKSRICKGKAGLSIGYALLYTTLYTGWIYSALFAFKVWIR
jgi:hypothetical protein